MKQRKLAEFLSEVSNWEYLTYLQERERLDYYTSNQGIVFSLLDACCLENIEAIKMAINRLDGRLATPVQIVYPKVYFLYPHAELLDESPSTRPLISGDSEEGVEDSSHDMGVIEVDSEPSSDESILPTLSIRQTLDRMGEYPRSLPQNILQIAEATHKFVQGKGPEPVDKPLVKSVVAAHLHSMAQNRNLSAIEELFNNIDGKLQETIQIVGEDIYITQFNTTAPYGAIKNADGVYMIEAKEAQRLWREKLET